MVLGIKHGNGNPQGTIQLPLVAPEANLLAYSMIDQKNAPVYFRFFSIVKCSM